MKKITCMVACALALAAMAPVNVGRTFEPPPVAQVVVAPATVAMAAPDVSAVSTSSVQELTPTAMSEVRGAGFWNKIVNIVKKVSKWIWNNRAWILQAIEQNTRRHDQVLGTISGYTQNDYYSQNEDQNDYYDEYGNLVNSTLTAGQEVLQSTETISDGL